MNKQEIFNSATYDYMNAINDISLMCEEINKDKKDLLYGFDILLQIGLMHLLTIDKEISQLEIEFLSKIVYENDLMKLANEKGDFGISWEKLYFLKDDKSYGMLVEHIYKLFEIDLMNFILSFITLDTNTDDDYLNRIKGHIRNISIKLLSIDGLTDAELEKCYSILNEYVFNRMDNIKNTIYLMKKKINIG